MQYLSVHDLVWINATATGETLHFHYDALEAAMAAQYNYGNSTNVPVQAANMLSKMLEAPIFEHGNRQTAFIAVTAFLVANGFRLVVTDSEAVAIVEKVASSQMEASQAISKLANKAKDDISKQIALRSMVTHLFNEHREAISHLARGD